MAGWYLAEEFSPDLPGQQVFVAPGPEDEPLVAGRSPWIFGRTVTLPARYWHRLLLAVRDRWPDAAARLDEWSGSADPDSGPFQVAPDQLDRAAVVLQDAAAAAAAGDLVPAAGLAGLGDYTTADIAGMLRAVRLVLRTARDTGEPFDAWYE